MGYAEAEVAPVVARLRETMLASTRIFADETVVPVRYPRRGRTKQGYFRAIARDDRPWGGSQPPAVVYSWPPAYPRQRAGRWLSRHPAVRWLRGLQAIRRVQIGRDGRNAGILLLVWTAPDGTDVSE
jgi:transposase